MSEHRTQIWSSGGGTQSCAIAAMIVRGELEKPDLAVIADTERECSTTWEYHDRYIVPALASVGVTIHRIRKSGYATVDLYRGDDILIPAFTDVNGKTKGKGGKLPTFCSNEWKSRVVRRWANEQGVKLGTFWLGFSCDEEIRAWSAKENETNKWNVRFPLLDARMRRYHCIQKVEEMGWPKPPRSRCWMCPNQGPDEWAEVMAGRDAEKAREFEGEIRQRDANIWLIETCESVGVKDFRDPNLSLFGSECGSGQCFV